MGGTMTVPITMTPVGGGLFVAGSVVNGACGIFNIVSNVKYLLQDIRYWHWKKNIITEKSGEIYWKTLAVLHILTQARVCGQDGNGKGTDVMSLNTVTVSRPLEETIEEVQEVVTKDDQGNVISKKTSNADQKTTKDDSVSSVYVTKGATKRMTKTDTLEKMVNGVIQKQTVETSIITTNLKVQQVFVVSPETEFEFKVCVKRDHDVDHMVSYWIMYRQSESSEGGRPAVLIWTHEEKPKSFTELFQLEMPMMKTSDGKFNLNVQDYLLKDKKEQEATVSVVDADSEESSST